MSPLPQSLPTKLTPQSAPWLFAAETQAVFAALAAQGLQARAVGGAVRNTLLGRAVADVDIATDGAPNAVMAAALAAGLNPKPTGIAHGTITVVSSGLPFEVTTLRRDVATDGRHAVVAFTADWVLDASRRDFTINALYADPDGTVFDPLGGLGDIEARRVRFIGDAALRIREDYLRSFRFFRFSAAYAEGDFDAEGMAAIVREKAGVGGLSAERVRSEMMKLLAAPRAVDGIAGLFETGLLVDCLGLAPRLGVFRRMVALSMAAGGSDVLDRLGALGVVVPEDAERLAKRWRLSGAEAETLGGVVGAATLDPHATDRCLRRALYALGPDMFRRRAMRDWAETMGGGDEAAWGALVAVPQRLSMPVFPVSGRDLLIRGVKPGKQLGVMLGELERWWILADFPDGTLLHAELAARVKGLGS